MTNTEHIHVARTGRTSGAMCERTTCARSWLKPPESACWLLLAGLVAVPCIQAQWLNYRTPGIPRLADGKANLNAPAPRTADGKPDLSGIWRAHAGGYALDVTSDLKASDVHPWAAALYAQRVENFGKDNPALHCFPTLGPGISSWVYKIVQTSNVIVFLPEAYPLPSAFRQILLDGRGLPNDPNPTWQGYSVGHWDDDTLVVESAGFNDKTWLDYSGHPHTEELHVTERFHRRDFGHMELRTTFDDPKAYRRPWTVSIEVELVPDTELLEYVCGENERDFQHYLTTDEDRKRFRAGAKVAPAVLSKYVGVYEELTAPGGKRIYEVTLDGDRLMISLGVGSFYFAAASETTFVRGIAGDSVEFVTNAKGQVTHFVYRSPEEGERRADRITVKNP